MSNDKVKKPTPPEEWELTPLSGLPKRRHLGAPVSSRLYLCGRCGQDFEGRRASTGAPANPACPICGAPLRWTDWPVTRHSGNDEL